MLKRIISGAVLISIIIAVIVVDWVCALTITFFIGLGLYEFFTMLEKKGVGIYKYFGIAIGLIIPFSILFRFELTRKWEFLFLVLALLILIVMQFRRRQSNGVIVDISTTLFGILYIAWFFSFMIKIRYLDGGLGFLISLLLITKLGDIGAYFIGTHFGKTPFMPKISPKKTVEGSIAGLIFSIIGALISMRFLKQSYLEVICIGIAIGILGQLGDLSESLMKRDCGVKDSGHLLPGMGGILDEIDSLLFTAPAFYFYLSAISA